MTFDIGCEERPFTLDIVPRVLLANIYTEGRVFQGRVIPRGVVASSPRFRRVMYGVIPPNGVRVHVAGIDLIRDADGVLEDNVRVPSGVSYVITNRRATRSSACTGP